MSEEKAIALPATPDIKPLEARRSDVIAIGTALDVVDVQTEQDAADLWAIANKLLQDIDAELDPKREMAHKLWKSLVALQASTKAPLETMMQSLKRKIAAFRAKIEEERVKKERELQAQARKLEEERILAEAVELETSGDPAAAEAVLAAPVVPVAVVISAPPKAKGVVLRDNWTFRITDEEKIPREFLMPDTVKIGKYIKAMKSDAKIPGVDVFVEKV